MLKHTSAVVMILEAVVLRTADYCELCTAQDGVRIEIRHPEFDTKGNRDSTAGKVLVAMKLRYL